MPPQFRISKRLMTVLLLAGCLEEGETETPDHPKDPWDPEGETLPVSSESASPASEATGRCPLVPEMRNGVVTCHWLVETSHPECGALSVPPSPRGLNLIPGQEHDVRVPAFCVVAQGTDSWCMRDPE